MLTFYPSGNTLNIVLRICFFLPCTLYFLSEGNTQISNTASGGVQSSSFKWVVPEIGVVKNISETDTGMIRSEGWIPDIKKTGSDKVLLSWTGQSETNLNYYIVERSRDGVHYQEKAIFLGNIFTDSNQHYSFTEKGLAAGSYFYRIKMVNNDDSYRLCATASVYFNDENEQLQLVTFPNPSSSEIKVTFEFYNASGQLANKQTAISAGKTEILNITTLPAGIYAVKAFTVTENAVGRIIKR